jgi:KRAB domain-containing zinc finger protein
MTASTLLCLKHINFMHSYHQPIQHCSKVVDQEFVAYSADDDDVRLHGLACPFEKCGKIVDDIVALKEHQCTTHDQLPKCIFCRLSFSSGSEWVSHIREHFRTECCYKCEFCYKSYVTFSMWYEHIGNHFEVKVVEREKLPLRKKTKRGSSALVENIDSNSVSGNVEENVDVDDNDGKNQFAVKFDKCRSLFWNRNGLERHELAKHSMKGPGAKRYKCHECGEAFRREHILQGHLVYNESCRKSVQDDHLFTLKCLRCSKFCGSWSVLGDHLAHSDTCREAFLYECKSCGMLFLNRSMLRRHSKRCELSQTASVVTACPTVFKCSTCDKSFACKQSLDRHRSKKHATSVQATSAISETDARQMSMYVHKCGQSFATSAALRSHSLYCHVEGTGKMEGKDTHKCHSCTKVFGSRYALKVHLAQNKNHCILAVSSKTYGQKRVAPCKVPLKSGSFECSLCGCEYSKFRGWLWHMKIHLLEEEGKQDSHLLEGVTSSLMKKKPTKRRLKNAKYSAHCRYCKKRCFSSRALSSHEREHLIDAASATPTHDELSQSASAPIPVSLFLHDQPVSNEVPVIKIEPLPHASVYIDTDEKPILCNVCGLAFNTDSALEAHATVHDNYVNVDNTMPENSLPVKQCIETFECSVSSELFASQHSQLCHKQMDTMQEQSADLSPWPVMLIAGHSARSLSRDPNVISSSRKSAVVESISNNDTSSKRFKCNLCQKNFLLWDGYALHMKVRHNQEVSPQTITCKICQRIFSRQCDYSRHLSAVHNIQAVNIGNRKTNSKSGSQAVRTRYKCRLCKRTFDKQQGHAAHMQTHKSSKLPSDQRKLSLAQSAKKKAKLSTSVVCKFCKERFVNSRDCFRHIKQHHQETQQLNDYTLGSGESDEAEESADDAEWENNDDKAGDSCESDNDSDYNPDDDNDYNPDDDNDYNPDEDELRSKKETKKPAHYSNGALGRGQQCKQCRMIIIEAGAYQKHIASHSKQSTARVNVEHDGSADVELVKSTRAPMSVTSSDGCSSLKQGGAKASVSCSRQKTVSFVGKSLEEYSFYFEEDFTDSAVGEHIRSVTVIDISDENVPEQQHDCTTVKKCATTDAEGQNRTENAESNRIAPQITGSFTAAEIESPVKCANTISWVQFEFDSLAADKHVEGDDKTGEFHCAQCNRTFACKEFLHNHMRMHAINCVYKYECTLCLKPFQRLCELGRHVRVKHALHLPTLTTTPEGMFNCSHCDRVFEEKQFAFNHMKMHNSALGSKYECFKCYTTFASSYGLKRHMRKQHRTFAISDMKTEEGYMCGLCQKTFDKPADLLQHRSDVSRTIYRCQSCLLAFHTLADLRQHNCLKHGAYTDVTNQTSPKPKPRIKSNNKSIANNDTQKHKFNASNSNNGTQAQYKGKIHSSRLAEVTCSICRKCFASPYHMRRHQKSYEGRPVYRCYKCNLGHHTLAALESHVAAHFAYDAVHCEDCNQTFDSRSLFLQHVVEVHVTVETSAGNTSTTIAVAENKDNVAHSTTPSVEKSGASSLDLASLHKCTVCNIAFSSEHELDCHLKARHTSSNNDNLRCLVCHKVFARSDTLKKHMSIHTGEKRFQCHVCERYFRRSSNRSKHYRNVHCKNAAFTDAKTLAGNMELGPYKCNHCGRGFSDLLAMSQHKKSVHHAVGNIPQSQLDIETIELTSLVCRLCGQAFDTQERLVDHSMKHATESVDTSKELAAVSSQTGTDGSTPNLSVGFTSKPIVQLLTVNTVLEYINAGKPANVQSSPSKIPVGASKRSSCNICGQTFSQTKNMNRHKRAKHADLDTNFEPGSLSDSAFACVLCQQSFSQKNALDLHAAFHASAEFHCEVCMHPFTRKIALERHVAVAHNETMVVQASSAAEWNSSMKSGCDSKETFTRGRENDEVGEFSSKFGFENMSTDIEKQTKDGSVLTIGEPTINHETDEDEVQLVPEINCNNGPAIQHSRLVSSMHLITDTPVLKRLSNELLTVEGTKQSDVNSQPQVTLVGDVHWEDDSKDTLTASKNNVLSESDRAKHVRCKVCAEKCSTLTALAQHLVLHAFGEQRVCGVCGYVASSLALLKRHISNHRKAEVRGNSGPSANVVNAALNKTSTTSCSFGENTLRRVCLMCGLVLSSARCLRRHVKRKHADMYYT